MTSTKTYILIAEDDEEDQFIMTDAFKEEQLEDFIEFVENGELAISYLTEKVLLNELPALIVLDLNMPLLNGTQTLRAIKQHDAFMHIPVIIYSTSLNLIEMEDCLKLSASSYIIKPNSFAECKEIARRFYSFCKNEYSFPTIEEIINNNKPTLKI